MNFTVICYTESDVDRCGYYTGSEQEIFCPDSEDEAIDVLAKAYIASYSDVVLLIDGRDRYHTDDEAIYELFSTIENRADKLAITLKQELKEKEKLERELRLAREKAARETQLAEQERKEYLRLKEKFGDI